MQEIINQLMIVPVLITILGLLLIIATVIWVLVAIQEYITTKNMNRKAMFAYGTFSNLVQTAVDNVEQTMRDNITNEELSDSQKRLLKQTAIDIVDRQLPESVKEAMKLNAKYIDEYINERIEQIVSGETTKRKGR